MIGVLGWKKNVPQDSALKLNSIIEFLLLLYIRYQK